MNWSQSIVTDAKFIERDLGDEIVLMSQDGQEIHSFEDTALSIWKSIKSGSSPEKIVIEILNEYKVEEDIIRNDLSDFLTDLEQKGIIKQV